MLTPEEKLDIGMKVLESIKPGWTRQMRSRLKMFVEQAQSSNQQEDPYQNFSYEQDAVFLEGDDFSLPSLEQLLDQFPSISPETLILGVCEDGLPLTLDLNDPSPGSILIAGDPGSGKASLLRLALLSCACTSLPEELSTWIITAYPEEYTDLLDLPPMQDLVGRSGWNRLLSTLEAEVEARRRGGDIGRTLVLAVDDLAQILQSLDQDGIHSLHTLLRHGPRYRVWTLATLDSQDLPYVEGALLQAFRTRILGSMEDIHIASYVAGRVDHGADELAPGIEFCTPFGNDWIRFWLVDAD